MPQTTSKILMIRPVNFKFNPQTAENNLFQQQSNQQDIQTKALSEFDNLVSILLKNRINVTVFNDTLHPETPDSIFPNNWVSFHNDGSAYLYPMFSENRRLERRKDILENLAADFQLNHITDLSFFEKQSLFLEGTGSMVLDRDNKIAYACLSVRTNTEVLNNFCSLSGYKALIFKAVDANNFPIYHTNVMMCIADRYAVICLESIKDFSDKERIIADIENNGKKIIEINLTQMNHFAGNMLQVENKDGQKLLVMSKQAYQSLTETQIGILKQFNQIIYAPIYTIEKIGGGSARCMMAEIHLPQKKAAQHM